MKKNCLLLLLTSSLLCHAFPAKQAKLSPDLTSADQSASVDVIVQWNTLPGVTQQRKITSRGGSLRRTYKKVNSGSYRISASRLSELAADPEVLYIAPDRPLKAKLDYSAAAANVSSVLAQGFIGTGIGVAIIDSGMVKSPDLTMNSQIVYNQDFTGEVTNPTLNVKDTSNAPDTFGHGQHVAGIIASSGRTASCGNCTRSLVGLAPGVNLINLKVLDKDGNGIDSSVIAAIDTAIALKSVYNIRVINLSLGRPFYESYTQDPLCQAVEQAWKAGIVVVVAAGNDGRNNSIGTDGYGTIEAPGNDPYVITVGAMKTMQTYEKSDDFIASYSSKGPTAIDFVVKPDVVAPGNQVVSLLASPNETLVSDAPQNRVPVSYYTDTKSQALSTAYFTMSGTSMATPVVTAAVADLLQAQPTLTPDQVKARIMGTASKNFPTSSVATDPATGESFVSYYDVFTVGAGYLDLAAAVASKAVSQGSALSPSASYDASSDTITISSDPTAIWSRGDMQASYSLSSVFGAATLAASRSVWGQGGVDGTRSVWGQTSDSALRSVWGQGSDSASRSVWGQDTDSASRSVWGQNGPAASRSVWGQSVLVVGEQ
jgi:serine protease AprX